MSSRTANLGVISLPPIGDSFMYIETSSATSGDESAFVSFERTDNIQISNINFHYNRFSILRSDSVKSTGSFTIQLLLSDNTWITVYNIPKTDQYGNWPTNWTLVGLNFNIV